MLYSSDVLVHSSDVLVYSSVYYVCSNGVLQWCASVIQWCAMYNHGMWNTSGSIYWYPSVLCHNLFCIKSYVHVISISLSYAVTCGHVHSYLCKRFHCLHTVIYHNLPEILINAVYSASIYFDNMGLWFGCSRAPELFFFTHWFSC